MMGKVLAKLSVNEIKFKKVIKPRLAQGKQNLLYLAQNMCGESFSAPLRPLWLLYTLIACTVA